MNNKDENPQKKFEMDFICNDNTINFPHSAFHYAQEIAWNLQNELESKNPDNKILSDEWLERNLWKLTNEQKDTIRYFAQSVVERVMINLVKQEVIITPAFIDFVDSEDDSDYGDSTDTTNLN